jgi:hypothetical protein
MDFFSHCQGLTNFEVDKYFFAVSDQCIFGVLDTVDLAAPERPGAGLHQTFGRVRLGFRSRHSLECLSTLNQWPILESLAGNFSLDPSTQELLIAMVEKRGISREYSCFYD